MCKANSKPKPKAIRGFTLIEALVALLVLTLGLLGAVGMQLKAMQSTHLSYQRSIATLAAQDAIERLWIELGENPPYCPDPSSIADDWNSYWSEHLKDLIEVIEKKEDGCQYSITVKWTENRFLDEETSSLMYVVSLPGELKDG